MSESVRFKLEQWFCDQLGGYVGVTFHPSRVDVADFRPPYGVVVCAKLDETITESKVYAAEVRVALLTSVANSTSAAHDAMVHSLLDRLGSMERHYESEGLSLMGYSIQGMEDVQGDEDESYADVVNLRAGVRG